jgi:PAS domain S-box-containing protein
MSDTQKTKRQLLDEIAILRRRVAQLEVAAGCQMEPALQKRQGLVKTLLDAIGALVVVLDMEGRIVCFNNACEQVTGYTFDEVREKCVWDLFLLPEQRESVKAFFDTLHSGCFPNTCENVWLTKDGSCRLIAWSNNALLDAKGVVIYVVGTGIDITERRLAEEALRDSEARNRAILDTAVDGIVTIDEGGIIETFNPAAERIFGYAAAEVLGQNITLLMPSPYREEHVDYLTRYLSTGERKVIGIGREVIGLRKDGTTFPMELSVSEVRLGDRRLFTGTVRDITARKQAEMALQESEERFRSLVYTVGNVIIVLSPEHCILEFNREAERVFGWSRQEVLGKNYVELFLPEAVREAVAAHIRKALLGEPPRDFENSMRTRSGQERIVLWNATRLVNTEGHPVAVIVCGQDVTERRQAEQELQRTDRLALVGQLASGLAHEIGTPLNVIAGNAELLRLELQAQGMQTAELDTIVEQADRITRLIERMLAFARAKEQAVEPLALYIPLSHALRLLETRFRREAITVIVDVPADLPQVWGAVDQLEQVFLNILVNAWHAMPQGGRVTIQACETSDHHVRIAFCDTGTGMSKEELAHAFQPFYSTKGDKGTGLGLAICKQIIESYHGSIHLDSTLGMGTTVTVVLPCADAVR